MTYVRDKKTNALLNNDIGQYKNILAMRKKNKENRTLLAKIDVLQAEITVMRSEIDTIKQALGL